MNVMLAVLAALEENNSREWYHAHEGELRAARAEFEDMTGALMARLGKAEPRILAYAPGELTFRLARDTRFSHDKSPYLPAFRCHMGPAGKQPIPVGFYLYVRPGNRSFLGGGLFADMFRDAAQSVREAIASQPEAWEAVITAPAFARRFTVEGSRLKNVPRGFDPAHRAAEYLKYKSWYVERRFEDAMLDEPQAWMDFAVEEYLAMKPFHDFLNAALAGFTMPQRK